MTVVESGKHLFNLLRYFLWSYRIRLYRMPKKLLFICQCVYRFQWKRLGRELLALGLLGLDLLGVPEIYDALGILFKRKVRGLSPKEIELIEEVIPDCLPVKLIKIDASSKFIAGRLKIAYVSFFTINYHQELDEHTFAHELIHVWQYYHFGSEYIIQALAAQKSKEGYDYGGAKQLFEDFGTSRKLLDFNFEQQGEILADYYSIQKTVKTQTSGRNVHLQKVYQYFIKQIADTKVYRW